MQSIPRAAHCTMSSVHLNAIRGAAALVVLLGHTRDLFFSSLTGSPGSAGDFSAASHPFRQLSEPVTMGNEAVIIFFVLSGYLVGGSAIRDLKRGEWSWKKYLIRRSTRLWIVLLPALLFGVAVDHLGLRLFPGVHSIYACPPAQHLVPCNLADRLAPQVVLANAFFLQTVVADTAGSNNALWSLANEFWYYLAFPMCILAAHRGQPRIRRAFYTVTLFAIALLVGKSILLLFFVWLLGALISILPAKLPPKTLPLATASLPLVLPLGMVLVRRVHIPRYLAEWIIALLFSLALYIVLHRTEPAQPGLYASIAGFFSRMSYTLYLVHLPLAVFLCACIDTPWHPWDKSLPHLALFLALNALLVSVSWLFYLAFERNTDSIRRALFHRHTDERLFSTLVHAPAEKRAPPVGSIDVSLG